MPKLNLYIETSVLNFLFADDTFEKKIITEKFFKTNFGKNNAFISTLVLEEIEKSNKDKRELLERVIRKHNLKALKKSEESEILAEKYIKKGIASKKYFNDALHIAIAVLHKMDAIVSWNLRHIVKLRTIKIVNEINKKLGFKEIIICTPEEVIA